MVTITHPSHATPAYGAPAQRYAGGIVLCLAAVVTPPDVISQVILFVVVYGLYEVSIFLVRRFENKREAELREDGYYDDEEEEFDDPIMKEFDDEDADEDDGMVQK